MIFWKNSLKCVQAKIEFEFIQLLYINQTIVLYIYILHRRVGCILYTQHNLSKNV